MPATATANLFRSPALWPTIPPWWLLSTPQAAALINLRPATLSAWRIRGEGPPIVPPMYLKPIQGNPIFYQYGAFRSWAAAAVGLTYGFEDQCRDFLNSAAPIIERGTGSWEAKAQVFEWQFDRDRKAAIEGRELEIIDLKLIEELDAYASRQPRWRGSSKGIQPLGAKAR